MKNSVYLGGEEMGRNVKFSVSLQRERGAECCSFTNSIRVNLHANAMQTAGWQFTVYLIYSSGYGAGSSTLLHFHSVTK